ncbi:hypothetical protein PUNSTDRAFT_138412 [Punctularia strigosozonata HHB-11173 SS5]|uniref:F-box domain-containing protein n=1 Tax=Punctularia strigosozonata (strain HHB-11173) TaxID=741275 RepID=R7S317_PUNST|nr:uncharacterized protein PUNSTDRAFT_138412 [Punctularia strigosozonata HHB-11173 SS5]EIN04770.1 hypothetical protein PUNSTDRAFT_138412 [Punctularia strigosozonata HHB-11173 SS5]
MLRRSPRLPPEMMDHVIDFVPEYPDNQSSQATLLALCLSCKATKPRSERNLFRAPYISSSTACYYFQKKLTEIPARRERVESLVVNGRTWLAALHISVSEPRGNTNFHVLPDVLRACPNLKHLTISNFSDGHGYSLLEFARTQREHSALRSLTVENCEFQEYKDIEALLCRVPSLRSLTMKDITVCQPVEAGLRAAQSLIKAPLILHDLTFHETRVAEHSDRSVYDPRCHPLHRWLMVLTAAHAEQVDVSVMFLDDHIFLGILPPYEDMKALSLSFGHRLRCPAPFLQKVQKHVVAHVPDFSFGISHETRHA